MIIKPMLATKLEWDRIVWPVYASPKIDGIRCVVEDGKPWSRTHKVLPNRHLQDMILTFKDALNLCDGELVVGDPAAPDVMNKSTSGIMSMMGTPALQYLLFDYVENERTPYRDRLEALQAKKPMLPHWAKILPQMLCRNREQLEHVENQSIELGYEGLIVRSVNGWYKQGRSTAREGLLLKLKRYEDAEAVIIGFEELMHNDNEAMTDVQGHTKRTSHKAGQRAGGMLGALTVKLVSDPRIEFSIGTGFDFQQREVYWNKREELLGQIVKFKFMPYGVLESTGVPRFPVFLGFRDPIDM